MIYKMNLSPSRAGQCTDLLKSIDLMLKPTNVHQDPQGEGATDRKWYGVGGGG